MDIPLAERLRPKNIQDVLGQDHVAGQGKLIHEIISKKKPISLILWGPPGSGKTTLARIIANETGSDWIELSAVTSGVADVRRVINHAKANARLQIPTLLFVDEIHRFNKAQQDAFLPHVEDGTITLIGATTENPSFEIITPLLSRSRVIVLQPLDKDSIKQLLARASKELGIPARKFPAQTLDMLAELSGGDARVALGNLELSHQLAGMHTITKDIVQTAVQRRIPGYDKNGEAHYNIISAFIKSMRGSDENATLYYLARMLQAGEDPTFIARRMIIFASEDIGMIAPATLTLAISTFEAVTKVGMPEAQYSLYHCATVLAKCQKSREIPRAMAQAMETAREYPDVPIPLHLRNAPTKLMRDLGYGKDYDWHENHSPKNGFLPPELEGKDFFKS